MQLTNKVTVIIATRNRVHQLMSTLDHLTCLKEAPQVIVMDNGSTDGTTHAVRRNYPSVRAVELERNFGAGARTLGARIAETPLIAFSDDDSWWKPGSLSRAAELFDLYPRLGLIAARVLVGQENWVDPISEEMSRSPLMSWRPMPGRPVLGFLACGAVTRRKAFFEASGFEERFGIGGEEQLLAVDLVSLDWDVCYVDEIVAYHHPLPSTDRSDRKARQVRNDLWSSWLRRPIPVALGRTLKVARRSLREQDAQKGLFDALKGALWVMENRKRLPGNVESALRLIESP